MPGSSTRAQTEDSISDNSWILCPLGPHLGFPRPKDPAIRLLERCNLRLHKMADAVFRFRAEVADCSRRIPIAGAYVVRALHRTVIECTNIAAVYPLRTYNGVPVLAMTPRLGTRRAHQIGAQSVMAPDHSPAMVHLLFDAIWPPKSHAVLTCSDTLISR